MGGKQKSNKTIANKIMNVFGFACALCMAVLCGILDIRKLGVEISEGTETIMFWFVRVILILCVPILFYMLIACIKELFNNKPSFAISTEGIYINRKNIYECNIPYEDIERISFKEYPNKTYMLFIFFKEPTKYLTTQQLATLENARKKIPEAGDIGIPSYLIHRTKEEVHQTIMRYFGIPE